MRGGTGRVFTPPPSPDGLDVHQALEEADAKTDEGQENAQHQNGVRADSLSHITDPSNGSGEHGADGLHQSSDSHNFSLQNTFFLFLVMKC